jgi:hypothetical protein
MDVNTTDPHDHYRRPGRQWASGHEILVRRISLPMLRLAACAGIAATEASRKVVYGLQS